MITIVDYGMGNVGSIKNMLAKIGTESIITSRHDDVERADKLILPGVGHFDRAMENINRLELIPSLNRKVLDQKVPILGICLGMQLLGGGSEEGELPGLGWIDARSKRFQFPDNVPLKVPHMGWNVATPEQPGSLFTGFTDEARFYFVHTFHVCCSDDADVLATSDYGFRFTSAVRKGNILGTQFHPEKSHKFGMRVLQNFVQVTC